MFQIIKIMVFINLCISSVYAQGSFIQNRPTPDPIIKECNTSADCLRYGNESLAIKDFQKTLIYIETAAKMGNKDAQFQLSNLYELDIRNSIRYQLGIYEDDLEDFVDPGPELHLVYLWLKIAALNGSKPAIEKLKNTSSFDLKLYNYHYGIIHYEIAKFYELGTALPKDYNRAISNYEKSIDYGYQESKVSLALIYEEGTGVDQDLKKARELYCNYLINPENKSGIAAYRYGILLRDGNGGYTDLIGAIRWLFTAKSRMVEDASIPLNKLIWDMPYREIEEAAYNNNLDAQYVYSVFFDRILAKKNHELNNISEPLRVAIQKYSIGEYMWLRIAADSGDLYAKEALIKYGKFIRDISNSPEAYNRLGDYYSSYRNANKNYKKAIEYYTRSIELNDMGGYVRLALIYENGLGVDKDFDKAQELLMKGKKNIAESNELATQSRLVK